jgi:hypothetical protein
VFFATPGIDYLLMERQTDYGALRNVISP